MKLASYNIQYGIGLDGGYDLNRIAESLAGADIIGLQEVTRGLSRNGSVDMVAALKELFPHYFSSFAAPCDVLLGIDEVDGRPVERRLQFGNMVLSRWPILAVRHLLLPRSRTFNKLNLQRGALEAVVDTPDGPLRFYSVHLDHVSPDERIEQIRFLKSRALDYVNEGGALTGAEEFGFTNPPLPENFVMMGDFNMTPESPEYLEMVGRSDSYYQRSLRANQMVDACAHLGLVTQDSYTWVKSPGDGTQRMHLDHCFINPQLAARVQSARVDHQARGSDHFPIWLELA
ncbi:MAG TPA: endonuclease/exonuclease/phosphatase family protein [Pseudorhizobium sp.]|jgi:endonuclease/exonuclease/phosphatase family metal-dependent hydrolase|nr:endonuclease/exonuclease/phosphatase family protein [Pseudorhizobium sp.]